MGQRGDVRRRQQLGPRPVQPGLLLGQHHGGAPAALGVRAAAEPASKRRGAGGGDGGGGGPPSRRALGAGAAAPPRSARGGRPARRGGACGGRRAAPGPEEARVGRGSPAPGSGAAGGVFLSAVRSCQPCHPVSHDTPPPPAPSAMFPPTRHVPLVSRVPSVTGVSSCRLCPLCHWCLLPPAKLPPLVVSPPASGVAVSATSRCQPCPLHQWRPLSAHVPPLISQAPPCQQCSPINSVAPSAMSPWSAVSPVSHAPSGPVPATLPGAGEQPRAPSMRHSFTSPEKSPEAMATPGAQPPAENNLHFHPRRSNFPATDWLVEYSEPHQFTEHLCPCKRMYRSCVVSEKLNNFFTMKAVKCWNRGLARW